MQCIWWLYNLVSGISHQHPKLYTCSRLHISNISTQRRTLFDVISSNICSWSTHTHQVHISSSYSIKMLNEMCSHSSPPLLSAEHHFSVICFLWNDNKILSEKKWNKVSWVVAVITAAATEFYFISSLSFT